MPDLDKMQERFDSQLRLAEAITLARGSSYLESLISQYGLQEAEAAGYGSWERSDPDYGFRNFFNTPFISRPDDYINGRCRPLYDCEQDLCFIRGIGRHVAALEDLGASVLSNLRNYTVGEGNVVSVAAKKEAGESYVEAVQSFVDSFLEFNRLTDDGESDALTDSVRDGDVLLWLKPGNPPKVRFVNAEHITEPQNPREIEDYLGAEFVGLDWTFGVATAPNDPQDVKGYFVSWYGQSGEDWEFVPAAESVFIKRNVPKVCKRGVSDFYLPWSRIDRASKLLDRTALGATIQSSIAYIKEATTGGSASEVQNALATRLGGPTRTVIDSMGQAASVNTEDYLGGRVPVLRGLKYHAGPMGSSNAPVYIDVYQAVVRAVGNRWCMPEYMISGDASNANYSSTLVAKSPFVQQIRQEQSNLARQEEELIWKAVALVERLYGVFGLPVNELKRLVVLEVSPPAPESQDPLKDEQVYAMQRDRGILSAKTHATKVGLDYDEERMNGAKENPNAPAMPQGPPASEVAEVSRVAESLKGLTFSSLHENCGTGDGGFKSGNSCGGESGGGSSSGGSAPKKRAAKKKPAAKKAKPKKKAASGERGATAIFQGEKYRTAAPRARLSIDQASDLMAERGYKMGKPFTDIKAGKTLYPVEKGGKQFHVSAKTMGAFLATELDDIADL